MSQHLDRRVEDRRAIVVDVSAWSLAQPTELLRGTTVDLSAGGALLKLPGLSDAAVRLEMRLALPERPVAATVNVVRRGPPDMVAVTFETIARSELDRLLEFIRGATV
jgi:hypothetical protein